MTRVWKVLSKGAGVPEVLCTGSCDFSLSPASSAFRLTCSTHSRPPRDVLGTSLGKRFISSHVHCGSSGLEPFFVCLFWGTEVALRASYTLNKNSVTGLSTPHVQILNIID